MKIKLIIATIALFTFTLSLAQQTDQGQYFQIPELKKFEGTWVGKSSNQDSLVVNLKFVKKQLKEEDHIDCLVGSYNLYKNNHLEYSSPEESLNAGGFIKKSPIVILTFKFSDRLKQKSGDLTLELRSINSNQAKWFLKNLEGAVFLRPDGKTLDGRDYDRGFSVPTEILLKKIN